MPPRERLLAWRAQRLRVFLDRWGPANQIVQQQLWLVIVAHHGGKWRALRYLIRQQLEDLWRHLRAGPLHAMGWHYRFDGRCVVCAAREVLDDQEDDHEWRRE
jgi:hypothetical protein